MNSSAFSIETYMANSKIENYLVSSPNECSDVIVLSISDEKSCDFTVDPIQDKISLRFHKDENFNGHDFHGTNC
jgi:hypothetical protein